MKTVIILSFLLFGFYSSSFTQQEKFADTKPQYDSLLAKRLGADEYGMKKYVMAFLKSGSVKIQDSIKRAELQREHLKNIFRLAEEGTLIVAGPFLDDLSIRGIFIFNVESVEEARKIAEKALSLDSTDKVVNYLKSVKEPLKLLYESPRRV